MRSFYMILVAFVALGIVLSDTFRNFINNRGDQMADRMRASIDHFCDRRLYKQDTRVTLSDIGLVSVDLDDAMVKNENNTSLVDALIYFFAVLSVYNKHSKTLGVVEETNNLHQMFRHMFAV